MIKKDVVLAKLKPELARLKQEYKFNNMELFGSVARGEQDANDVDILITYDVGFNAYDWGGLYMELTELLGCSVDVVLKNNLSEIFAKTIADDLIAV